MKGFIRSFAIILFVCLLAAGCASQTLPSSSSAGATPQAQDQGAQGAEITHEDKSVQLIRSMMALAYASMPVAKFNATIQTICTDAGTTVFEVISDAYDHFAVYGDTGEFVGTVFSDKALETFMETTLAYSAQEIFGEPVHLGNIMYMTMPGYSAVELYQVKEQMPFEEWNTFFEDHIAEISVYPILSYALKTDIASPGTLLVADRDGRINAAKDSILNFFLAMDAETAVADTLWDILEAKFETISVEQSDANISITCSIQGLERDMPE